MLCALPLPWDGLVRKVAFADPPGAVAAVERVRADYDAHRQAARALAESHFAAPRVLENFLVDAGVP